MYIHTTNENKSFFSKYTAIKAVGVQLGYHPLLALAGVYKCFYWVVYGNAIGNMVI